MGRESRMERKDLAKESSVIVLDRSVATSTDRR